MTLNEYLTENNFEKKDLTILFSVGCVLNVKNGDTFPMMNDDTFDFDDPMNIVDMDNDRFSSQEWFDSLAFGDKEVVEDHLNILKESDYVKNSSYRSKNSSDLCTCKIVQIFRNFANTAYLCTCKMVHESFL